MRGGDDEESGAKMAKGTFVFGEEDALPVYGALAVDPHGGSLW
jgi:hypothetical protein